MKRFSNFQLYIGEKCDCQPVSQQISMIENLFGDLGSQIRGMSNTERIIALRELMFQW